MSLKLNAQETAVFARLLKSGEYCQMEVVRGHLTIRITFDDIYMNGYSIRIKSPYESIELTTYTND